MIALLRSRRFAPVFWCQFFSAFNDNFIKNALVILILYKLALKNGQELVTLSGFALVMPAFFLSAIGGEIADKFDKARVAARLKLAEFPIAALAACGFLMTTSSRPDVVAWSVPVLFTALMLFGALASLFGPIKYGILPDHLEVSQLPTANALMEAATFFAILGGTIVGGLAFATNGPVPFLAPWVVALGMVVLAGIGWWSATLIQKTGAAQADIKITPNLLRSTFRLVGELRAQEGLWIGGLIVSWFWLSGIVALSLFPSLVKTFVGGDETVVTFGLVAFTVGIAIGSAAAAILSHRRANLMLVPIGAILMGVFSIDIGFVAGVTSDQASGSALTDIAGLLSTPNGARLFFDLAALAAAGGLFIVPAFAALQAWAPAERRARVIAAVNILNAAFMTVGTLAVTALQVMGTSVPALFVSLGVLNFAVAAIIIRVWGLGGEKAMRQQ